MANVAGFVDIIDGNALVFLEQQVGECEKILARVGRVEMMYRFRKGGWGPKPAVALSFAWFKNHREHATTVYGGTLIDALCQACQVLAAEFPEVER